MFAPNNLEALIFALFLMSFITVMLIAVSIYVFTKSKFTKSKFGKKNKFWRN